MGLDPIGIRPRGTTQGREAVGAVVRMDVRPGVDEHLHVQRSARQVARPFACRKRLEISSWRLKTPRFHWFRRLLGLENGDFEAQKLGDSYETRAKRPRTPFRLGSARCSIFTTGTLCFDFTASKHLDPRQHVG